MPYEELNTHGNRNTNQTFRSADTGAVGGISHLRLRDQWSAWVRDRDGHYHHQIFDTREEALDALRRNGIWDGLPAS